VNCPMYSKALKVKQKQKHWNGSSGWLDLE
jgi:diphthamide synthase (EF-2-diphthine--ammonia ligase)